MMDGDSDSLPNHEERLYVSSQSLVEDDATKSNQFSNEIQNSNNSAVNFLKHDYIRDDIANSDENFDQLTQKVMELSFQNDYLKAQIEASIYQTFSLVEVAKKDSGCQDEEYFETIRHLQEKIGSLNNEIQEQKETQKAAENALNHLRAEHSEADRKVQELSLKLIEGQQQMEREIKERDDKHGELDSKFGRLHKRAKQRIQELQKEKDDLEARLHDLSVKAEQASSQQTAAQQEVERTRQQANEALRSMNSERQQLRATNNKLRDNVDEMRRALEAKESAFEELQRSIFKNEQALAETQRALQAAEERHQFSITDLCAKHQKQLGGLDAQLADALTERRKADEEVASLRILITEKHSKIVDMEAISSGEVARLGAALEEARGELIQYKDMHEKEILDLGAGSQALRTKLETIESTHLRFEIETAKIQNQLEFELSMQSQLLNAREAELVTATDEIILLEKEFSAYKVRAHALLQKKDNELAEARSSEQLNAKEEAIKEARREIASAMEKRDSAIKELHDASERHSKEISARDDALMGAENDIRIITMKLNSIVSRHQVEREAWQRNLESAEEGWRRRYAAQEAEKADHTGSDEQLEELKLKYNKLKEEHAMLRDIAERTVETKDEEIEKLVEDNKNLSHALKSRPEIDQNVCPDADSLKQDAHVISVATTDQQILLLARRQAQREEELAQSQRHIFALQEEIEELERENRLHGQQEAMLKEELRNMERSKKREGVDMTYLKNIVLKLLETGEVEALLPVIGMLLQFSPNEIKKCQQAYRTTNAPSNPSTSSDSMQRSLFSRFSFSG